MKSPFLLAAGAIERSRSRSRLRPTRSRGLYLVPDRRIQRARHAPVERTLHLVDIENLVGGSAPDPQVIAMTSGAYRRIAPVRNDDHVVVAAGASLLMRAGLEWRGAMLRLGRGVNGADLALLTQIADEKWIAEHFDRVILGSGDGIFAPSLARLRSLGIATGVVAPARSISWRLRRAVHFVKSLDGMLECQEVA